MTKNSLRRARRAILFGAVSALVGGACTGDSGQGSRDLPKDFVSTPWVVAQSERAGRTLTLAVFKGCLETEKGGVRGIARFDHLQVDEGDEEIFIAALSKRVVTEGDVICIEPTATYVTHELKAPLGSRKFVHARVSPDSPKPLRPLRDARPDGPPPPRLKTPGPYVTPTGPEPTTLPNGEPI